MVEKKKKTYIVVAIIAILLLISGGTYAYWQWQSTNNTLVNIQVEGAELTISGETLHFPNLVPTTGCFTETEYYDTDEYSGTSGSRITHNGKYTGVTNFLVDIYGSSRVDWEFYLVLKARITTPGRTIRPDQAYAIKWALTELDFGGFSPNIYSYSLCRGEPYTDPTEGEAPIRDHSEGTFYLLSTTTNNEWVNIHTGLGNSSNTAMGRTFSNQTGEYLDMHYTSAVHGADDLRVYQLYVWLEDTGASDYNNDINMGATINDNLQNLSIEISVADTKIGQILPSRIEQHPN